MTKKSDFEIKVLLHQLSIVHKQLKTFKLKGIKRNCNRKKPRESGARWPSG